MSCDRFLMLYNIHNNNNRSMTWYHGFINLKFYLNKLKELNHIEILFFFIYLLSHKFKVCKADLNILNHN